MAYVLAAAMVLACQVAEACPGCKQAVGGDGAGGSHQVNGQALGYALGIGMMFFYDRVLAEHAGLFHVPQLQGDRRAAAGGVGGSIAGAVFRSSEGRTVRLAECNFADECVPKYNLGTKELTLRAGFQICLFPDEIPSHN